MNYLKNQKKNYKKLNERLTAYIAQLHKIYEIYNKEASSIALRTNYTADDDFEFKFSDFPETKYAVERLQRNFSNSLSALVYSGISKEWKNSNEAQDLMANEILKKYNARVNGEKYKIIYQTNSDALKAFLERKDKGFGISDKIWNQSGNYIKSLEAAISTAISKGTSAVTLSKQISKYLIDFKKLQKDYKSKFGQATDIHDCEYRSARLARSEINMAYRTAEQTRWNQMDFVLGYEIELSNSHPKHDICDTLSGSYPKDFKWTGWHPNDLCHCVPILMSESDFIKWNNGEPVEIKEIKDVPEAFKQWVFDNQNKIGQTDNNKLPYWVRDNRDRIDTLNATRNKEVERYNSKIFSEEQMENNRQISKILNIPQGKAMSFTDANGGKVNPEFNSPDAELNGYYNNCQTCTLAYELRRRGFNVEALPNKDDEFYKKWCKENQTNIFERFKFKDRNVGVSSYDWKYNFKDTDQRINFIYNRTTAVGRYEVLCSWEGGGGHVFIVERQKRGNLLWYDPQTGRKGDFNIEDIQKMKSIGILKIDNLLINTLFLQRIKPI